MIRAPIRLLDDPTASAALRRDLAAAANHHAPYDVTAGAARLEASLAKGAGAASSGWGAGSLGLGALILSGLIGAGVWLSWPSAPADLPSTEVALATPQPEPVPPDTFTIPERRGEEVVAPEEVVEDMSDRAAAEAPARPVAGKKAKVRRPPARGGRAAAVEASETGADYLREARSLQAARGFLGREPATALARAEAGALEFVDGAFAQEWEGVAILALFELGRLEDADRRGTAFLAKFPNGPYAAQVREAQARP